MNSPYRCPWVYLNKPDYILYHDHTLDCFRRAELL